MYFALGFPIFRAFFPSFSDANGCFRGEFVLHYNLSTPIHGNIRYANYGHIDALVELELLTQ